MFDPFFSPSFFRFPPKFSREGILRLSQDSAIVLLRASRFIAQAFIFAAMAHDLGIMFSLLLYSDI